MPLFEVSQGELVPFRRLKGGEGIYETEIEDLLWANVEEFTGETLFPVRRQAKLPFGGIPDVLALEKSGRVVIFEIKRDVDRRQLAQCLEYAGWARTTSLDELAALYHGGEEAFWTDWQDFTESSTPVVVNRQPRLVLVARDFQERTASAFEFLVESGVPVSLVRASVYEDATGRRFVDVEGDHEPEIPTSDSADESRPWLIRGRRVRVDDLLEHGLVAEGEALVWDRPRLGKRFTATIEAGGAIRLEDGRVVSSPSRAAVLAADQRAPNGELQAHDGWRAWVVTRVGKTLDELRRELHTHRSESPS